MNFLTLILLACSIFSAQGACDTQCDGCWDLFDVAKITCSGESCTIDNGELLPDADLNYLIEEEGGPITAIDEKVCRSKCEEHAANTTAPEDEAKCEFFRYVDEHNDVKHCSLQTGCVGPDGEPDETCADPYCYTGQIGCSDKCDRIMDCEFNVATWTHDKFHIICAKEGRGDINIYKPGIETIPGGTICRTVHMCPEWNSVGDKDQAYYRQLAVFCNETDGTMKALDDMGGVDMGIPTGSKDKSFALFDTTAKTIVEPSCCAGDNAIDGDGPIDGCRCDPLDKPSEAWADLICEQPLVENKVTDPNSCMLLCDNSLTKSFSCEFNQTVEASGSRNWMDAQGKIVLSLGC